MALRVFISYTHETQEHMNRVWDLSERLRADGVDCRIDQQEESPIEGWPRWCRNQVQESQFVLIVSTAVYQRRYEGKKKASEGPGEQWESFVITQELYEAAGGSAKFIPVVLSRDDAQHIPLELRGLNYYDLSQPDSYDKLFRRLTSQPTRRPSLPPLENPFFTGREEVLDGLKKTLDNSGIAALTGLGGIGKTQIAAQYAHRHRNDYPFVLWVRAESADTLFADLVQLAARLELPEREAKDQSVVVAAVERWLDGQERWLLVLDNVEDYGVVRDLARKANENGRHVIITTQRQALGQIGRQRLAPMEREQGAVLLLRRAGRRVEAPDFSPATGAATKIGASAPGETPGLKPIPSKGAHFAGLKPGASTENAKEAALAREISDEVGGLPLALDQAGAYIEETGCGLEDYLTLLRQRFEDLAQRRGGVDSDHPVSVAATFAMSFDKLAKQDPAAAELLNPTAFLVPDAIPEEIFTEGAAEIGPVLQAAASDPVKWDEAIAAALKYSLIERKPSKLLAVHPMVQAVARSRMSAEERSRWAEQVVRAVNAAFPDPEFAAWSKCERLTASAQACAVLLDEYHISSPEAARLLNQAAAYLNERARYAEAEPLYRRALGILEEMLGAEHPDVATSVNNLAQLLQATNRPGEAEPLMRRVLEFDEGSYGPNHPNVAIDLNNLAQLLKATNRLGEAEPLYRRALQIDEKALGPDNPNVAIRLNNLAMLMKTTNRLAEAEPLHRRALAIWENALGAEHPQVAAGLNNLAELLRVTNRLDEAEPLMRRALAIDEKSLGSGHPNVAIRLNNLAMLLQATNRLSEAEPLMRRALAIFQNSLGPEHPNTITVRENLAVLLRQVGKNAQADKL